LSVLGNFVQFEKDREKILRFDRDTFRIEPRTIMDPTGKKPKSVNAAIVDVIEEDGVPVKKRLSTVSDKLATTLRSLHVSGYLYQGKIGITMRGEGFTREYSVRQF